jgi:phage shock protein C
VTKVLYRSCRNKMVAGVASGIGEYFGIDPTLVRLIWAVFLLSGFGFVAYLLAWIIIPLDPSCESRTTGPEEIRQQAEKFAGEVRKAAKESKKGRDNTVFWFGIIVVALGLVLIIENVAGIGFWKVFGHCY